MLRIGLTGGIASGKSTVAARFRALGVTVIDSDAIAREVVAPGSEGLARIVEAFGERVLQRDAQLDRAALRGIVFADPAARSQLEAITHPMIRTRSDDACARAEAAGDAYCVLEIPLLIETGRHRDMDRVLVVDVSEETQIARVVARDGGDETRARQILAAQVSRAERLAAADDIIDNHGTLEEIEARVDALHRQYLALAAAPR